MIKIQLKFQVYCESTATSYGRAVLFFARNLPLLRSKVFVGIIFFEELHLSVTASIYITKSHG